jgi:hypothetical protein
MLVACVANTGSAAGPPRTGLFYFAHSRFPITIGREYVAHAIGLFDDSLAVLVRDDDDRPGWYPLGLFEVKDGRLPADWVFGVEGRTGPEDPIGRRAIWGYGEVAMSPEHRAGLEERDQAALRVFRARCEQS